MRGRYGPDELSMDLVRVSLALILFGLLTRWQWMIWAGFAMTAWAWFRLLSRDFSGRRAERERYLPFRNKWTAPLHRIRHLRTHRVFRCERCDQEVKVPRKKGTVRITCPSCGHRFIRKT